MTSHTPAARISLADIFTADFWRYLFKSFWLFFPGIIFLFLGYFAFWTLSQGKDIMRITLEQGKELVYLYCILAVLLWTYVTWYTSRLVGKAKGFQEPDENHIWVRLRLQIPRLMGFSCLTVVILALLQIPGYGFVVSSGWSKILFLISIPCYFLIYVLWEKFIKKDYEHTNRKRYIKFLCFIRNTAVFVMAGAAIAVSLLQSIWHFQPWWGLIIFFMFLQIGLPLLLIIRRKLTEMQGKSMFQQDEKTLEKKRRSGILSRFKALVNDEEDRIYSRVFLGISILPFIFYIITIISVRFSVHIGSFPFTLLAFSVLLILGNFTTLVSVLVRFNMHIIFWALAFFVGQFSDPHKVRLVDKQNSAALFSNRQTLKEYFTRWVQNPLHFNDSIQKKQPVYFVLADGGASRSGYWAASVLSRFEDSTKGKFSRGLFCLSGASGGSSGNATFFSVLRNKSLLENKNQSCLDVSRSYLKSDFLTYTLARMLGPDVFRYVLPFLMPVKDRGFALSRAMEEAPGPQNIFYDEMKIGLSEIMTLSGKPADLPILCINTTRMQDGRPGVISTINMNESYFNKRVDVLSLVDEDKDLKLSSAVVLGASFPYLSPAGRIDKRDRATQKITDSEYFVDGGYFDNSGAGVVNEMIIGIQQIMKNDPALFSKYMNRLEFFILHITNDPSPGGEPYLNKVNPLTNDLAAPIKTLVGSYGTQTSVNDSRLENFMRDNFGPDHYTRINLYKKHDKMSFPMNWVISKRVLDSMDARLEGSAVVKTLWKKMNE